MRVNMELGQSYRTDSPMVQRRELHIPLVHLPQPRKNNGQIEKEALALVFAVRTFHSTARKDSIQHLPVTTNGISEATLRNYVLPIIIEVTRSGNWLNSRLCLVLHNFHSHHFSLVIHDGCLLLRSRVVILYFLQRRMLKMLHEGHLGTTCMKMLTRKYLCSINIDKNMWVCL
uniref:Integrase_H2C2 domain-containing protein n=1 Tax=Heterorhabditis bacteriophora TaxID=37862 RepID=A0A1I7WHH2_HETBA